MENLKSLNNNLSIIGITGGSGSGKTYLCNKINELFNKKILIIQIDSYYKDLSHIKFSEREKNNFDHPSSFEFELLYRQLLDLNNKKAIKIPIYNYKKHLRRKDYTLINKEYPLILVEGILSLYNTKIRNMMCCSVFIDTYNHLRKERRISRDLNSRERTLDSILNQYESTVEPMYKEFIEPTKEYSDIIIKECNNNDQGYKLLLEKIKSII